MKRYRLLVVGGGSGWLVVALGGARFGLKVALIEKDKLGGDCLWTGCVPSKALLHAVKVANKYYEDVLAGWKGKLLNRLVRLFN